MLGINWGELGKQIMDPGGDYDIFRNASFDGGVRDRGTNATIRNGRYVPAKQGAAKPGYDKTGRLVSSGSGGGGGGGGGWGGSGSGNTNSGQSDIIVQGGFTGAPGYGGGGYAPAAPAAPAYDPKELAKYDQAIKQIEQSRGRVGKQLDIAKDNIADQFNVNSNELKSARSRAQNDYTGQTTSNQQGLRTNYNNINDVASMGMRGLARLLGSYGAVGSDMNVATDAVTDSATAERSGANSVYAQNQRGLDTNWGNFQEEHKNQERRLADWRAKSTRAAEAQSKTTEQDLLNQLARLRGERAQYKGGDFAGAAQSALNQANKLSGQIDQLGRFKPTYSGKTPVYRQRALDSYQANDNATIDTSALPGANNRYLARLLGQDEEREDRVAF